MFAPTDEAFAKIPPEQLEAILEDKTVLTTILQRHVVPRTLFARGIAWEEHETAGGEVVATQVFKNNKIKVASLGGSALVTEADMICTNGVIHAIDTVI